MLKRMVMVAGLLATPSYAAEVCIHSLPTHREGHWKYKYVHGEKCWFGPGGRGGGPSSQEATSRHRQKTNPAERKRLIPPTPVEDIAAGIEEEVPDPALYEARRVKTFPIIRPPNASRRIDAVFDEFVRRCEASTEWCDGFWH